MKSGVPLPDDTSGKLVSSQQWEPRPGTVARLAPVASKQGAVMLRHSDGAGKGIAMETVECEVWIIVDESGDYTVGKDEETAAESYRDQIGTESADTGIRRVKVTVKVPKPRVLEAVFTAPVEDEAVTVS
jgi:hypothetical protein